MFEEISYALIFGKPLIFWLGISTLTILIAVALIGYLIHHGNRNIKFSWHKYLAAALIIIALTHGILGILHYL